MRAPAQTGRKDRLIEGEMATRVAYDRGYDPWLSELSLVSITRFIFALADSMHDDGTVIDRGPRESGCLVVSLDALK